MKLLLRCCDAVRDSAEWTLVFYIFRTQHCCLNPSPVKQGFKKPVKMKDLIIEHIFHCVLTIVNIYICIVEERSIHLSKWNIRWLRTYIIASLNKWQKLLYIYWHCNHVGIALNKFVSVLFYQNATVPCNCNLPSEQYDALILFLFCSNCRGHRPW